MGFIYPWGIFAYKNMPFGLKNVGDTFHQVMLITFHDLKNIIEVYMDESIAFPHKRVDHPTHLRLIFETCFYYRIRLNLNKCIFCVVLGHLLGFIVSNKGIMVDLLKVEKKV
jgi:cleavage and polyadenylation specificity factor subunit 1